MDVCIERSPGDCGVRYDIKMMSLGLTRTGGLGYGLVCDDYIMFRGEKTSVCGRGDGRSIIVPTKGPAGFTFSSNRNHTNKVRHFFSYTTQS